MLPFSDLELENFVLKVSQGRRRTRGAGRPESAPLKEFGGKLYEAVFQGELRDVLQSGLIRTRAQRAGMRLRLRPRRPLRRVSYTTMLNPRPVAPNADYALRITAR